MPESQRQDRQQTDEQNYSTHMAYNKLVRIRFGGVTEVLLQAKAIILSNI